MGNNPDSKLLPKFCCREVKNSGNFQVIDEKKGTKVLLGKDFNSNHYVSPNHFNHFKNSKEHSNQYNGNSYYDNFDEYFNAEEMRYYRDIYKLDTIKPKSPSKIKFNN